MNRMVSVPIAVAMLACASTHTAPRSPAVHVDESIIREWAYLYKNVRGVEWMTCMVGTVDSTGITARWQYLADVDPADYDAGHVVGVCGGTAIGMAHSHPPYSAGMGPCYLSATDKANLPGKAIVVAVCGLRGDTLYLVFQSRRQPPQRIAVLVPRRSS